MTSAQAGPPGSGENPPFILDDQKFARLERELRRVPGVRSARVAGVDAPTEIHIVASLARSPKQLVRDVQSLASAGFGMPIDHRIVSVVQLEEEPPPEAAPAQLQPPEPAPHARPVLERVVVVTRAGMSWIKVVFRWPSGEVTEAVSTAEASREARARASVATVLRALEPALRPRDARIEIE
ncbi:MAG: hypothetical protein ACRDJ5_04805, partial [Actinomycetota bacterium]